MVESGIDVQHAPHFVVIGSSAGGIEALSKVLSALPGDFPATIVIAQHLAPEHPSHLANILARHCPLPVETVVDQQSFMSGVVYVVPQDREIEIVDSTAHLEQSSGVGPHPSVNRLFSSAASAFEDRLIAVVLSGTGSDGAAGAREVHNAGGTVIVQNPETAAFPGMPRSLAPVTVDIVTNLENIGPLLQRLVRDYPTLETPSDQSSFQQILDLVRQHHGMDFSQYSQPSVVRRLRHRMLATHHGTLQSYLSYLRSNPGEEEQLIGSFVIKVTDFFRDEALFTYLREELMPELIDAARAQPEGLRVWSVGCSTGEEAYSIAILVMELLRARHIIIPVKIFATDLESDAVAFARRGVFPSSALRNMPPDLIERYFVEVNGEYEVIDAVRKLIVFGLHDLVQTPPFPHTDLILCRNVLVYFTAEIQTNASVALAFSLRPGGCLVLGNAESSQPLPEYFAVEQLALKIFRRSERPVTYRFGSLWRPGVHPHQVTGFLPRRRTEVVAQSPTFAPVLPDQLPTSADSLLLGLPVGVAVVDRHYDIQTINVAAREMLGIHGVAIGEDILHLLTGIDAAVLRTVIDTVFDQRRESDVNEVAATDSTTGQARYYHITGSPPSRGPQVDQLSTVMIVIRDVTPVVQQRLTLERQLTAKQDELTNVVARMQAMAETNRRLLDANEQLTLAEERWRALRDEYALAHADATVANEELEVFAEELQASGEEIEALNEELRATIDELGAANASLEEQSNKLEEQRQLQEDFVEHTVHEIRTPLTAIHGYLQLILRHMTNDQSDDTLLAMVEEALDQARRLEGLVTDLMDVTRVQNRQLRLDLERVDLVRLIKRVVEVAQTMAQGQTIVPTIEPESLLVHADLIRIESVLYNLLTNAIKYAPGTTNIDVTLRQHGEDAEIVVRDYGPGIPASDLPNIFNRLYQIQSSGDRITSGLGLGLFITKEIVAAHRGTIEAFSTVGEGTAFVVRLPLGRDDYFDFGLNRPSKNPPETVAGR